jgi:poly(A) polymerase
MTERDFALDVVRTLQKAGFTALWAGGCVRDELLGLAPADYDVATDARPDQLRPLFRRRNEIGASFGVVQVIGPRGDGGEWLTVEVATFRSDGTYTDGRRPDSVVFSSPEEDAKRRDFTINGMFFDPVAGELRDYVGGRADLSAKVLRAIGDPTERFAEDKLRILRAVRMAARFELSVDPETLAAARRMAPEIRAVSAERVAEELRKLLSHRNRARGVRLIREFGLVGPVLPELEAGDGWDRGVRVVECLGAGGSWSLPPPPAGEVGGASPPGGGEKLPRSSAEPSAPGALPPHPPLRGDLPRQGGGEKTDRPVSFPLAFAALLHTLDPATVAAVADRLRLSTAEKTRTAWLVENRRALVHAPTMRLSQLKPMLVHPGIGELLELHQADALAAGTCLDHVAFCERYLRETPADELNPPPAVTGEDLIALGLKPGREFKTLLDAVREAQLDGRVRSKAEGLELVRGLRAGPAAGSGTPPPG